MFELLWEKHKKNNNIFKAILKHNPNFVIWLGNSVYLDKPKFNILSEENEKMDWDFIKKAYYKVKTNKYYSDDSYIILY